MSTFPRLVQSENDCTSESIWQFAQNCTYVLFGEGKGCLKPEQLNINKNFENLRITICIDIDILLKGKKCFLENLDF